MVFERLIATEKSANFVCMRIICWRFAVSPMGEETGTLAIKADWYLLTRYRFMA